MAELLSGKRYFTQRGWPNFEELITQIALPVPELQRTQRTQGSSRQVRVVHHDSWCAQCLPRVEIKRGFGHLQVDAARTDDAL